MTTATRIYTVTDKRSGEKTLVESTHPSLAVKAVADQHYSASITPSTELVALVQGGATLLRPAKAEPEGSAA